MDSYVTHVEINIYFLQLKQMFFRALLYFKGMTTYKFDNLPLRYVKLLLANNKFPTVPRPHKIVRAIHKIDKVDYILP